MRNPHEIINDLSPTDVLSILSPLTDSDERFERCITGIATAYLCGVDREEVAAELYHGLDTLKVEEVWD